MARHWTRALLVLAVFVLFFMPARLFAAEKLVLSLKGAIDISLERNLSIAEVAVLKKEAEADVTSRKGEFDPALKLGLSQAFSKSQTVSIVTGETERNTGYDISLGGKINLGTTYELKWAGGRVKRSDTPFFTINPYYSSGLSLSLTQPLLKGFGKSVQESGVNVAKNTVDISALNARTKAIDVIAQTASAYWGLYYARSGLDAAELSLDLALSLREEISARIDAGALAPVEIYKGDAEAALRQEALVAARKAVYDSEDSLKDVMNLEDWDYEILTLQTPPEPIEGPLEMEEEFSSALEEALEQRSDYRAALIDQKNKGIMKKFYENQKLPGLSLMASSGLNGVNGDFGEAFSDSTSGDYYSWMVGVSLNIPLGNRTAKGDYLKAKLEEERAGIGALALRQRVNAEVREAVRAVRLSAESYAAARATKEASLTQLDAEEAKFKLGMATVNDVFEFQDEYARAIASEDRALSNYATAVILLKKAKGTLLKDWQ